MKSVADNILTNVVPTCSAQNTKSEPTFTKPLSGLDLIYSSYASNPCVSADMKFLLELQLFFGLRVSEALNLGPGQSRGNGVFEFKTLKRGENRTIQIIHNEPYIRENIEYKLPLINRYTRYYVYRLYKKLGIYQKYNNNRHDSVTHYFRHELILYMKSQGLSDTMISKFMGWKGDLTIQYYL